MSNKLIAAFCTYNRADRLEELIHALRKQECQIPFEILVINNNSSDQTEKTLTFLESEPGATLHHINELRQGIPFARNRALDEAMDADYFYFMDDDELPRPGLLKAVVDALQDEGADCAGGGVINYFEPGQRPKWLGDELLGFLAEVDHGKEPFWIVDDSTPIWTSNVGYRMSLFKNNPDLRFDVRYNREGKGVGGGSDLIMFKALLEKDVKIRYRPDMVVEHRVESWRLTIKYFLRLHFTSGMRNGLYELAEFKHTFLGIPYFMFGQAVRRSLKSLWMFTTNHRNKVRQGMNASYIFGQIYGCFLKERTTNN